VIQLVGVRLQVVVEVEILDRLGSVDFAMERCNRWSSITTRSTLWDGQRVTVTSGAIVLTSATDQSAHSSSGD
jgi:hypothetical protein